NGIAQGVDSERILTRRSWKGIGRYESEPIAVQHIKGLGIDDSPQRAGECVAKAVINGAIYTHRIHIDGAVLGKGERVDVLFTGLRDRAIDQLAKIDGRGRCVR